jgi:small subunit ribosomal protein S9
MAETVAPKKISKKDHYYPGVGRRKRSVATIRLTNGKGVIKVNDKTPLEYFGSDVFEQTLRAPLVLLAKDKTVDINARVEGGGLTGQADAIRLGIARALLGMNEEYRVSLRKEGFLTRDARVKERKKPGLKKARKAPQFSKR